MSSSIREWLNLNRAGGFTFFRGNHVGRADVLLSRGSTGPVLEKPREERRAADGTAFGSCGMGAQREASTTVEKQKSLGVTPEQVHWFRLGSVDDGGWPA